MQKKEDRNLKRIHDMCTKAVNNIVQVADVVITKGKRPEDKIFTESEFKKLHSNIVNGLDLENSHCSLIEFSLH